jgi:hypothetical protein
VSAQEKGGSTAMSSGIEVTIWGWKGIGIGPGGSVGHVMITNAGTAGVVLSQFPHAVGDPETPYGPNTTLSFLETKHEMNRPVGVVFAIDIPDTISFSAMASNERERPIWCWDPELPRETHCARAAYDALRAGGLNIDPEDRYLIHDGERKEILPNSLWTLLSRVAGASVVQTNEENVDSATLTDREERVRVYMRGFRLRNSL